jgi:heptosyltransferase III
MGNASEKTFLICHPGSLGDVLLTAPALLLLKKLLPRHRRLAVGRADTMRLLVHLGLADAFVDGESRECIGFFSGESMPDSLGGPDGAVMWLKEGRAVSTLLERNASNPVLCIDPAPDGSGHIALQYLRAVQTRYPIRIPRVLWDDYPGTSSEGRRILIHPGSGSRNKNLPPEFYLSAAAMLKASGFDDVKFVMGPAETGRGEEKLFPAGGVVIPENAVKLAVLLRSAALYIGNDSGASHLAGYLGVPTIVLYKSTDHGIWGVLGKRVHPVQAPDQYEAWAGLRSCLDKNGISLLQTHESRSA